MLALRDTWYVGDMRSIYLDSGNGEVVRRAIQISQWYQAFSPEK